MRTCTKCGESKPLQKFPKNPLCEEGRTRVCKTCDNARQRTWRRKAVEARPDFVAARALSQQKARAARYGLSLAELETLEAQGTCDLCGREAAKTSNATNRLHVDHCHTTGKVRGLLCSQCNTGIGLLGDTPEALLRAAHYVCTRT